MVLTLFYYGQNLQQQCTPSDLLGITATMHTVQLVGDCHAVCDCTEKNDKKTDSTLYSEYLRPTPSWVYSGYYPESRGYSLSYCQYQPPISTPPPRPLSKHWIMSNLWYAIIWKLIHLTVIDNHVVCYFWFIMYIHVCRERINVICCYSSSCRGV